MLTPIKQALAEYLKQDLGLSVEEICNLFEIPKELDHGHLAIPVFFLARERRKAPPLIAKEIAENLLTKKLPSISRVEPVGGYINIHLDTTFLLTQLYSQVQQAGDRLGCKPPGSGPTMVIDYSSPNVAKPMHVGHLRATVIGQAIRNLAETQGYKVIGVNHIGDWGVQFGKLIYAYQMWGEDYPFEQEPFESLFKLYVRFHEEAEKDPELGKKGSLLFKQLEDGDPELRKLWQKFVDISMADFERQWKRLGIRHDLVRGEAFYNDRLRRTEDLLEKKGLLVESEGAMVVDLSDENMPPCLIRKGDGASLYATRDIASAIYRMEELKADLNLYVVGAEQTLHFKQVFSVLRRMGYKWWDKCHHVSFGLYRFKDVGKMSSRKGRIIRLEDVLDKAVEMVRQVVEEKNPGLLDKEKAVEQIAYGAITFNDLINDRVRDVEFDWDKALSFEGDSGPYLQYVYVRCRGILQKYGRDLPKTVVALVSREERDLMKTLMRYEEVLEQSFKVFRPNILATYLLDVSSAFNKFYHNHRIVGGESDFEASRVALVFITQNVIQSGLRVLNIQAPVAM